MHFRPGMGENYGSHQFLNWWQQYATGILRFDSSNPSTFLNKTNPIQMDGVCFMAEQEGFEPSVPFWGTHDFQSCPL